MARYGRLFLTILIVALLASFFFYQNSNRAIRKTTDELFQYAMNDEFYEDVIREYFEKLSTLEQEVCFNDTDASNCLKVLLVDVPKGSDQLAAFHGNANALGEFVVVDKGILDRFLVMSNYVMWSKMSNFIFGFQQGMPFGADVLWMQDFTVKLRDNNFQEAVDTARRGAIGFESRQGTFPDEIVDTFGGDPSRATYQMLAIGLGYLIEHELYHIQISKLKRVGFTLQSVAKYGISGANRIEEFEADRVAIEGILQASEKMVGISDAFAGTDLEYSPFFVAFWSFWLTGLNDVADDFDQELLEDLAFEISFGQCYIEEFMEGFPNRIAAMLPSTRAGRLNPLPLLSDMQLAAVRERLNSTTSHQHDILRADRLYLELVRLLKDRDPDFDIEMVGALPGAFSSIAGIEVPDLRSSYARYAKGLGTDIPSLSKLFSTTFSPASPHTCPADACYIGNIPNGRIEVVERDNEIIEVRVEIAERLQSPEISASLGGLTDIDPIAVEETLLFVGDSCPGYSEFLQVTDPGPMIYVNRSAQPGALSIRALNPY